jgi:hypothetical protein
VLASLGEVKGKAMRSACWEDREGASCLVVWGRNNALGPDMECDSELRAAKFKRTGKGYRTAWQIRDFSKDCMSVQPADSLRVVDVDGDGVAETGFFYEIIGDGADPYALKFLLHYKDGKYAIRGRIPRDEASRYEKESDPSLLRLPAAVRAYAEGQWEGFVRPILEDLEDGEAPGGAE